MARTFPTALADALKADPGRPLVTFYDDATGERVELSVKTFDNWVSKIANLFSDELGLDAGDGFSVSLPTHWLSPAVVAGGWAAGLVLSQPSEAAAHVVGPSALGTEETRSGTTVACSLRPLGGRFVEPLPAGWLDFHVEVPPQPDALLTAVPVGPDDTAVAHGERRITHAELIASGEQAAARLGLSRGGRLATDANPADHHGLDDLDGLVTALAAPLAVDASVVLVVNATAERRRQIAEQERASVTTWGDRAVHDPR